MPVIEVVKNEVNDKELVSKFKSDDIKIGAQLVVYPTQTAFFLKGGKVLDEFTSGTYTIKTENIPLLGKVINLPFGGDTPFQAEVWFVNQISLLDCKWGTMSPIQIEDPKYGVIVPVRSYGQYGFHISEPRKFLERLVGNMSSFSTQKLTEYFRGVILSKLTNIISDKLTADGLSVININSHVEDISQYAKERLQPVFNDYGVELEMFNAIAVSVNEQDPSFQRLKEAKDAAAKISIIGKENYQMTRSFDVLEKAAENEGGGAMNAAIGIGAGVGIGGQVGSMVAQHINTNLDDTPPPIPVVVSYYLAIGGKQHGPFDFDAVASKVSNGEIDDNTLLWKKGMRTWERISIVAEFKNLFDDCPPPIPTI